MSDSSPTPGDGAAQISDPEDRKLVTLARATKTRARSTSGAALRDVDGRTYAAAAVALASLRLSAVHGALAMAVSSAAGGVEAVVVLSEEPLAATDLDAVRDLGGEGVPVRRVDARGQVLETAAT